MEQTKFCKHCGEQIPADAVICVKCGCQVEKIEQDTPNIVINNTNDNINANTNVNTNQNTNAAVIGKAKNKWVSFCLCLFLGYFGAHKFYEGKVGLGILYLLTIGLFGIGWIADIFIILFKPNPYYV